MEIAYVKMDKPKENKIRAKTAQNGEIIYSEKTKYGDFEIITFVPKMPAKKETKSKTQSKSRARHENETSIIALIKLPRANGEYEYSIFMADAGVRAFNLIKNQLPQGIKILKAGHHGAKNVVNKEMLEYLKPEYTIISTGYNTYGHPNPETIRLLINSGSTIYSTKSFGALKFEFKNEKIEVSSFLNHKSSFSKKFAN